VTPLFPLDEVKRICAERDVELGKTRCLDMLTPYIDPLRCYDFAREVVAALSPNDFSERVQVGKVWYDEYGVRLPVSLKQEFGIQHLGNFYVKLRISKPGDLVFFISLHQLEKPLFRLAGRLDPT